MNKVDKDGVILLTVGIILALIIVTTLWTNGNVTKFVNGYSIFSFENPNELQR